MTHDQAAHRFQLDVPGGTGFLNYRIQGDHMYLLHVEVPEESRGQGHAAAITKAAIEWGLASQLKVVPICPFTVSYMRRHPEYSSETR